MERFRKVAFNIQNLSLDVTMHHMVIALRLTLLGQLIKEADNKSRQIAMIEC